MESRTSPPRCPRQEHQTAPFSPHQPYSAPHLRAPGYPRYNQSAIGSRRGDGKQVAKERQTGEERERAWYGEGKARKGKAKSTGKKQQPAGQRMHEKGSQCSARLENVEGWRGPFLLQSRLLYPSLPSLAFLGKFENWCHGAWAAQKSP